jgi:hypothetical protein
MLARLGDVLYWTGCLLGILLVVAAVAFYPTDSPPPPTYIIPLAVA